MSWQPSCNHMIVASEECPISFFLELSRCIVFIKYILTVFIHIKSHFNFRTHQFILELNNAKDLLKHFRSLLQDTCFYAPYPKQHTYI